MKTCKSCERDGKENDDATAGPGRDFESLLSRHQEQARWYALRLAGNLEEAEEIIQQASYKVLVHWQRYDPLKSFQGWYLTIIRNLFLDGRRRFGFARTVSLDGPSAYNEDLNLKETLAYSELGILDRLERNERDEAVRAALAALPEKHRAVLVLCEVEGLRYADAARKLRLPYGTLRSRMFRARVALRHKLMLLKII